MEVGVKVVMTRESVAAGDDAWAPHTQRVEVDFVLTPEADYPALAQVLSEKFPVIFGGYATWVMSSNVPLVVLAQQWGKGRQVPWRARVKELDVRDGVLHVHFSYIAQVDPDVTLEVLKRTILRGPG